MGPTPADKQRQLTIAEAYRMRWKRRRLLWRSFRARRHLRQLEDRTADIGTNDLLLFAVLRNEILRLPYFLDYYRSIGISRFLMVDNGSTDGSDAYFREQPDVSLWQTSASYRDSRFGLDWVTWLLMRHGHGHWCLTVDIDELLISEFDDLPALVRRLDADGRKTYGALMIDLYPQGRLGDVAYAAGQDPLEILQWYDAQGYRSSRQYPLGNLWVQGGPRERMFFADHPRKAPTLNKIPLIKWNRRYAYVNSTHSILPGSLNGFYDGPGGDQPSGALLHTKFLPEIVEKSAVEKEREQHFHTPADFADYYDAVNAAPTLWHPQAVRFNGFSQLEEHGLVKRFE